MSVAELERSLVDLGRHLAFPPEPDLAPGVMARLERIHPLPVRAARPRRAVVLAAATLALLVGGTLVASPGLRAAIARLFTLPGVRIVIGEAPPPAELGHGLRLGRPATLDEAREGVTFDIAIPEALGDPDEVYLREGAVSLVYEARPGLPEAAPTGAGALLTEFSAEPDREFLLKKLVPQGVEVVPVVVDGELGYWVEGAHTLFLLRDGVSVEEEARLAGNTLLWTRDGVTLRLETDLGLQTARRIAQTVG